MYNIQRFTKNTSLVLVCTIPLAKLITVPEFWEDKEEDSSVLIEAGGLVFAGG